MQLISDIGIGIVFVVGAVVISSFMLFLLISLKDFIVKKIDEFTKKTFRINYAELVNGVVENKSCFGETFVRTYEEKYMIVRARNVESAMNKFYRGLTKVYGIMNPKYAILCVIKEDEIK